MPHMFEDFHFEFSKLYDAVSTVPLSGNMAFNAKANLPAPEPKDGEINYNQWVHYVLENSWPYDPKPSAKNKEDVEGNPLLEAWCMFDQNNDLRLNPREFLHMVVHLISQKR